MSITLINILGDGTIYPPLRSSDLVIRLSGKQVIIGEFDKHLYTTNAVKYLHEPINAADLKADVLAFITAEMPGLFTKPQPVYIICPASIAVKARWERESQSIAATGNTIFSPAKN